MSFMQPELIHDLFVEVTSYQGETECFPADVCGLVYLDEHRLPARTLEAFVRDYVSFDVSRGIEVVTRHAWGARFTAPGYMDCTEWSLFDSEEEARAHLAAQCEEESDVAL